MIRFLLLVALFFLAVLGFDWLKDTPGEVALTLGGRIYVVDLARAMAGLIALVAGILIVVWLGSLVWRIPAGTTRALRGRKAMRGREAISRGLIAIAAGDIRAADRAAAEARKISPEAPLTLLLSAQAAQIKGDAEGARDFFTTMLDDDRTRIAGLRGLHVEAERAGEVEAAHHFATKAQELTHQAPWANRAILRRQIADRDWPGALATLSASADNRNVDRDILRRHRAVILTAEAIDIEESDPDTARRLALEAHELAPDLVPAATVAGRLLGRHGDVRRAGKVLETSWKAAPHPEISEAYTHVRSGDSARDRLKRAEALAKMRPHSDEGRLAVARAAIDARDWVQAREALMPVLKTRPTQNALILMSEIEEGEHGDRGRAREWLARAVHAPRNAVWTADGVELEAWAPVSPVTGRIDAVEWRVPVAQLGSPEAIDLDLEPRGEPVVVPAIPAGEERPKSSGPEELASSPETHEPDRQVPEKREPAGGAVTDMADRSSDSPKKTAANDAAPGADASTGSAKKPAVAVVTTEEQAGSSDASNGGKPLETAPGDGVERAGTALASGRKPDRGDGKPVETIGEKAAMRRQVAGSAEPASTEPDVTGSSRQENAAEEAKAPSEKPSQDDAKASGDDAGDGQDAEPRDPITLPRPDDPGVADGDEDPDGANRRFRIF